MNNHAGIHLESIQKRIWPHRLDKIFPFGLSFLQTLDRIEFITPVTILVGENGSGKSTFLEAIACASQLATIGSANINNDPSLQKIQRLANYLKLSWKKRTHRGFFLRAEDFFGFAKRMKSVEHDLEQELQSVEEEYADRSVFAKNQARMAYQNELRSIKKTSGEGLDSISHGESFLKVFQSRFVTNGLYLLDEPEAPLSPLRQLGLMALIRDMVAQNSQFVYATHSPILMAYPGATIFNFENGKIRPQDYEELEHVTLTRDFLNNPSTFIDHLWHE